MRRTIAALALLLLCPVFAADRGGSWTQFGGPDQSFKAASSGLAETWPESGPPELWARELGQGYSGILFEDGNLYTMFRDDDREVVACMKAGTGETVWEHRYESEPHESHVAQFGKGPRATPLISGDTIYTIGIAGKMHAIDKKSGKPRWSHDLWKDFGGTVLNHGYSSSPIAYGKNVIALVGGEGHSLVAFDAKSGKVSWKSLDFDNSYSTPRILKINGRDQLVTFLASELIGADPKNGELLWRYPIENQWKQNINMPVLVDGNRLFLSSLEAGARGLELVEAGGKTEVKETWSTRKIQFYHVTSVLEDGFVYGSTGNMGPSFLASVDVRTGEIAWRKRGFAKANVLMADGKLLVLDEEGTLYLTTVSPEDMKIHSQSEVLERVAWTVPTIIGKTLYVRDQKRIVALDLG